jgi:hypothetical protein
VKRRERTRQLIELGGLVAKAGLVELTGDDRAVIYGALLTVADQLRDADRTQMLARWGRRRHRAFAADLAGKNEGRAGGWACCRVVMMTRDSASAAPPPA